MNKKSLLIIMLIIIMACGTLLVACGGNNGKNNNGESNATESSQDISKTEESSSAEAEAPTEAPATEAATTAPTKAPEKKEETKANKPSTGSTKPTESVKATEAPKAKTCTVTVDGYCSSKTIEIEAGETVYDILRKTGASVSARNTGYGVYVEGINGRFEFDEGPTSGWIYTVNGNRPSTSCNKYEVKAGDKIVWTYVEEM